MEIMHATSEVPTVVPQLAGTLHRDSNIDGGTSRPGDTEDQPSTPGGDEEQEQPAEPSVQKELFKAEDLKGDIANGDIIYDGENISVQFTENKATLTALNYSDGVSEAVANDGSGLTFSKMILPNGSTCNYIITANKSCTVTVYYTCTDKSWANSSTYGKSGILMVNGTLINEDSATAGNKLSGTAYAYTFTVTAGQTYTLSSSSNRLVLFGISSS